jgi:hypothetical protein
MAPHAAMQVCIVRCHKDDAHNGVECAVNTEPGCDMYKFSDLSVLSCPTASAKAFSQQAEAMYKERRQAITAYVQAQVWAALNGLQVWSAAVACSCDTSDTMHACIAVARLVRADACLHKTNAARNPCA